MLSPGQRIDDLPLLTPRGDVTGLGTFRGEACVLIFLRHLG